MKYSDFHNIKDLNQFKDIIDNKINNIKTLKDIGISPKEFKKEAEAIMTKHINDISARKMKQ